MRGRNGAIGVGGAVAVVLAGWLIAGGGPGSREPAAPPSPAGSGPRASASGKDLENLLAQVEVVPGRPRPGGYDRGCSPGHGCVFGPSWSDDTSAPGGHNGCGTRDDVLAAQMTGVSLKSGSRCVVVAGILNDPYTGRSIAFTKADAGQVQVDHVYPLAAAWDMGAWQWPADKRAVFANDVDSELIAVSGSANREKGDSAPGEWLPPNEAFRCEYVARYLVVALKYGLPVTSADVDAIRRVSTRC